MAEEVKKSGIEIMAFAAAYCLNSVKMITSA